MKVVTKSRRGGKTLLASIAQFHRGEWGFTGTLKGMNRRQNNSVGEIMRAGMPVVFHHGGAIGADFEAHAIWRASLQNDSICNVWPASEDRALVFRDQYHVRVEPVMPPLMRNVEIVKRSQFLLAVPKMNTEELRSGTWHTIRQTAITRRPVLVVWPSGEVRFYLDGYRER